ncbi:MAG: ferredoxin [Clostridia bacterium]|nr:ferredoxin [Clostridia bacterium]
MRFYVNEDCIACEQCVATCPEVFSMVDGHSKAIGSEVPADLIEKATAAMDDCPVNAIQTE